MDPDTIAQIAKRLRDVFEEAEVQLLEVVAKRLARGVTSPGWAEAKLAEIQRLRREVSVVLRRLETDGAVAAAKALEQAWSLGQAAAVAELTEVGSQAGIAIATSRTRLRLLIEETVRPLRDVSRSMLRVVEDAYRAAVAESSALLISGVDTRITATRRVVDDLARRGFGAFVDSAGRRWELASYAEMATRTAANRSAAIGRAEKLAGAGHDLVIVSDHLQECALCRPWEGQILSISGRAGRVRSLDEAISGGLLHPNCRHTIGLYVPGFTKKTTRTADPEGDRARTQQRAIERQVRRWKRRERAAVATGDSQAVSRARAGVKDRQLAMRQHLAATGLRRRRDREQLVG